MRSPAELRRLTERACRGAALLALAALAWRVWRPGSDQSSTSPVARSADLAAAFAAWIDQPAGQAALALDVLPSVLERDWLRAVRVGGARLTWSAPDSVRPAVVALERLSDPNGGMRLTTLADTGATLVTRDALGTIDSARVAAGGVRTLDATLDSTAVTSLPGSVLRPIAPDSGQLRPVLLLGRAGWEGKFIAVALEEAGWRVETRFEVAPGIDVRQGPVSSPPIDTGHYAAVVALDRAATPRAAAIVRYVRDGGGLILTPDALRGRGFAALQLAVAGPPLAAKLGAFAGGAPRDGLVAISWVDLPPRLVILERRGVHAVVAAGRVELGRVLLLGYEDTWRWRMLGGREAVQDHRRWWSGLVASVARPVRVQSAARPIADPAPYASLVATLGAPIHAAALATQASPDWWTPIFFLAWILFMLTEWASRRLRGAR